MMAVEARVWLGCMNDCDAERWSWGCMQRSFSVYLPCWGTYVFYISLLESLAYSYSIRTRKREKFKERFHTDMYFVLVNVK